MNGEELLEEADHHLRNLAHRCQSMQFTDKGGDVRNWIKATDLSGYTGYVWLRQLGFFGVVYISENHPGGYLQEVRSKQLMLFLRGAIVSKIETPDDPREGMVIHK